ncbi:ABC transporter substrate-binding protein [[Clostridium] hylemonae]|uniref:ABC transporter substrate-binding protein n=1 Tax=[Clostridium] hylemonae TaxID=89153 RepID=UPI001FAB33B5|nr:sugar ABC transporter substrate-binding protein [[Clostridium] hylemonae]
MKKRVISVLLCAVMVGTMLAGCGGGSGSGGSDDGKAKSSGKAEDFDWKNYDGTTINVMFNEHNYSKAVISKIKDFEELTGIKVEYSSTPESNYFDKLNTSLSSRSGTPDVYMTGAYQVWEYASAGYMEPLEDYINDASKTAADYNYDDFISATVDPLKWDLVPGHAVGEGSQWALPMGWELNNLAYNKKVFEEKGITVPTTTDELLETAKSLNEFNGSGSYGIAVRGTREWATIHPGYMSLFATWGGKDFAIEDGKLVCQLDSKEAIEMTDYWVNLIKEAGAPQWSNYTWYEASSDLGAGKAAMLFDATSAGYFQNYEGASDQSGNIAWSTIPLPEGKTEADMKANVWIWSLAMNADSKNKDAAWYFIQYFTSPDYMLYAGTDGASPDTPRTSVMESDEYKAIVGKADNYLESIDVLSKNATIQFTPQPYFFECTTKWAEVLQDLVLTDKYSSTEDAMKQLKKDLDTIVSDLEVSE